MEGDETIPVRVLLLLLLTEIPVRGQRSAAGHVKTETSPVILMPLGPLPCLLCLISGKLLWVTLLRQAALSAPGPCPDGQFTPSASFSRLASPVLKRDPENPHSTLLPLVRPAFDLVTCGYSPKSELRFNTCDRKKT